MDYECTPLSSIPPVQTIAAPELGAEVQAVVREERDIIDRDPHSFNGPMTLCATATAELITVYPTDFAHACAHYRLWKTMPVRDGSSPLGLGVLAAMIVLYNEDGQGLWTQRSQTITYPGQWGVSANGGIDPGEEPSAAAARELQEELGLTVAQIRDFRVTALVTGGHFGVTLVFSGVVDNDVPLVLDPNETVAVSWERSPERLLPQTPMTHGAWLASRL